MSDVTVGVAPNTNRTALWDELAITAVEHRGEWVSIPLPDGQTRGGVYTGVSRAVAHALGVKVSVVDGVIHVKVPR